MSDRGKILKRRVYAVVRDHHNTLKRREAIRNVDALGAAGLPPRAPIEAEPRFWCRRCDCECENDPCEICDRHAVPKELLREQG